MADDDWYKPHLGAYIASIVGHRPSVAEVGVKDIWSAIHPDRVASGQ